MSPTLVIVDTLMGLGAGAQVDAVEGAFGPLEFGGTMYKFAVPIISLAFLMMLAEQFLNLRAGTKPDWGRPFIRTAGFILLLTAYAPFSNGVIGAVHMAGSIDSAFADITAGTGSSSTSGVLAKRAKEFQEMRKRISDEMKTEGTTHSDRIIPTAEDIALITESLMTSVVDDLLYVVTWFTFTFAAFAIFALKILSAALTSILLEVGPLMIAFAALPGLTTRYLSAWVMALIEVTAWGPIAAIILKLLASVNAKSAGTAILEDANYAEHIVLNFVYAGLFLAVPTITHMIFSGGASAVGNTGMAAAVGGLAAAGRTGAKVGGAAVEVGGQAAQAVGTKAASVATAASERVGDAVTGAPAMQQASAAITEAVMQNSRAEQKEDARALHAKRGAINLQQRRGD